MSPFCFHLLQLFEAMTEVLGGYQELIEQFVVFLLPHQVQACGKLTQYLRMQQLRVFIQKLSVSHTNTRHTSNYSDSQNRFKNNGTFILSP
jgi:hypothetical protein